MVRHGLHDDMLKARLSWVGGNTDTSLPDPLAHGSIGIMVKAVHAIRPHAAFLCIAVPALPDGSVAVIDRVQPAGVLALEE